MVQVERVLHHLLETVGKMFRRVAISFGAVFVAAIAIVEGTGFALSGRFGEGLVHAVAVVIGFSLALNVALAVAIEEGLRGFLALIRELAKDAEKIAVRVGQEVIKDSTQLVHFAEREAQTLASGAGKLVQGVERGASTALRNVEQLPGKAFGAAEGLERRLTGRENDPPANN